MLRTGWFKFHRQIFDNPICTKDAEHFFVWCYLLTEAQHEDGKCALFQNKEIVLERGQLIKTVTEIANDLHIKEMKVYRILKLLENEKQIVKRTSNKNTLITVLNWEKYQSCEKQNEEPMKNECKTDVKPSYYNKEIKKDKNVKNKIYTCAFEDFWKAYPRKKDKGNAFKKFNARLNSGFSEEELIEAAKNYADECQRNLTETKYIKHPATFLSDSTPFIDYLKGGDCDGRTGRNDKEIQVRDEYAEEFERLLSE